MWDMLFTATKGLVALERGLDAVTDWIAISVARGCYMRHI